MHFIGKLSTDFFSDVICTVKCDGLPVDLSIQAKMGSGDHSRHWVMETIRRKFTNATNTANGQREKRMEQMSTAAATDPSIKNKVSMCAGLGIFLLACVSLSLSIQSRVGGSASVRKPRSAGARHRS